MMDEKTALKAIGELDKFGINLGLSRITACLESLGNPQDAYPTVHIGGTNGKGSTSAFLASILKEAGYRVGLYTSPPLQWFGERMRINGEIMPDSKVPALYEKVLAAAGRNPKAKEMTQFEIITAMAFTYFAEEKVDAAVIEVGMGGRLDSTNVIKPLAVAVTNVGLEHSAHLGNTVEAIAREKAGIAKRGAPFFTAAREPALGVLREEALKAGAAFHSLGEEFSLTGKADTYTYKGKGWEIDNIALGLPGPFQRLNAALSLGLAEALSERGFSISEDAARRGLLNARWPGRLELFLGRGRVLLDGAHNPHAAEVLAEALKEGFPRRNLTLVLGILEDKDAESIIADLTPLAQRVILTRSSSTRALDPAALQAKAATLVTGAEASPGVEEALELALEGLGPEDLVVVTGSLTLVGEARGWLLEKGWRAP